MRNIAVEEAQVGDVLEAPLHNAQGRVLLPKGAKLSPAVLARLKGWGIVELTVEGEDEETEAKGPEERREEFERRFADWEEDPLMMRVKQIAAGHLFGGGT